MEKIIHSHASFGDSNYPASKVCIWHLSDGVQTENRRRHQIMDITFDFFELEEEADCNYDYLEITSYGKSVVKKCGTIGSDPSQPIRTNQKHASFGLPGKSDKSITLAYFVP